ncbi:hypothetical protein NC652_017975 [Populus alba x Populus x berolinensis]|nr:hypothetical protein NC652_017975 [Populus alba x Populus x berolinensis]
MAFPIRTCKLMPVLHFAVFTISSSTLALAFNNKDSMMQEQDKVKLPE